MTDADMELAEREKILKDSGSLYFFHNNMPTIAKLMGSIEEKTRFIFKQFINAYYCPIKKQR